MGETPGAEGRREMLDRRSFLGGVATASLPLAPAPARDGGEDAGHPRPFPGLIIREQEPLNLESPFPSFGEPLTPTNRFFVRGHFPIPRIDPAAWRLRIEGEVRRALELTYDDLKGLPAKTIAATIECAGNGRAYLIPKAKGLLWGLGAVGNAEWTGVPLSTVLDEAGLKDEAVEVILEGADRGEVAEEPKSPGAIAFERSLPLDKARKPEVLLAYRMNGEDLEPEHGAPVRVIVPGWYGMASVKWLARITVTPTPFRGYWQTIEYAYFGRERGHPTLLPVTVMEVKSAIAQPALHEVIPPGAPYRISGAAWAGESQVAKVEVSADDGATWREATLLGEPIPFSWRLWECEWQAPHKPGRYRLMSRATDDRGRAQPMAHDRDRRAYMISHSVPIEVEVG